MIGQLDQLDIPVYSTPSAASPGLRRPSHALLKAPIDVGAFPTRGYLVKPPATTSCRRVSGATFDRRLPGPYLLYSGSFVWTVLSL